MDSKPKYTSVLLKVKDYDRFIANLNTDAAINNRIKHGVQITAIMSLKVRDDSSVIIFAAGASTKDGLVGVMEELGVERIKGSEALDAVKAYYSIKAFEEYDKMIGHYTPKNHGQIA
ncbi:hypothetical protein HYW20_05770 [Candidatus Woesearchaeota archaeon]|nr:hypothetical protein [Candidatus Woesearchaeota archaeon]